jgi:two-component system response regulator FixJ
VPERVYITDDDAAVRRLLKKSLDHHGMITRTFESGSALLAEVENLESGVILLDIRMPEIDGLEVLEKMGAMTRVHAVLMVSSHGDVSTAVRAIHAGAIDFIEKPFSIAPLVERIRQLHSKIKTWETDKSLIAEARSHIAHLSEREKEVGMALANGLSNKEIARHLALSPRTVEAHRARLMKKLGISSLADIVRIFLAVDR